MTDIVRGKRVYSGLYGGRYGTIYAVHGEPGAGRTTSLGGGVAVMVTGPSCHVDVVFDDGTVSRQIPEGIIRGVQWDFPDEPLQSDEQIEAALAYAEQVTREVEAKRKAKKEEYDRQVQAMKSAPEYEHLLKAEDEQCRSDKLAAKNIRRHLKLLRPGVKFSVRMNGYASIMVTWPAEQESDNLNQTAIRELLSIFITGRYDPHEDYHYSEDSPFNRVYGGVDYLSCQRQF